MAGWERQPGRQGSGSSAAGSDPAPRPAIDSGSGRDFPDILFEVRVYCSSDVSKLLQSSRPVPRSMMCNGQPMLLALLQLSGFLWCLREKL